MTDPSTRVRPGSGTGCWMREALGARHIKVTPDGDDGPWDRGRWAGKFAELATQAQDAGARLGIEFFPWSNIKTLHDGLGLVADAGHDAEASSSTSGASTAGIRRSRSSRPCRRTASSASN